MIKPEAVLRHFGKPTKERERALADRFNDAFDITHGFPFRGLSIWLANGKPKVKARFGLDQEIVIVYSRHQSTDMRVVEALEKGIVADPNYVNRVDRIIAMLVHEGPSEEAAAICAKAPVWVVVPISAGDLMAAKDPNGLIRATLFDRIGEVDLFGMNSPVWTDSYFFGRDELVQNIVSRGPVSASNHGVFGLRKTGKTSVLWAIERRLATRPVVSIYLDLHTPGNHGRRWWALLQLIAERSYKAARGKDIGAPVLDLSDPYRENDAPVRFTDDMEQLLQSGVEQVVLLMDEVEWITPGLLGALGAHWYHDFLPFWQTIRGFHQENHGRLSYIVAGVNSLCLDQSSFPGGPNPIFQSARLNLLSPFDVTKIRQMIRGIGQYCGVKFEEDIFEFLLDHYGGHPFLSRIACSVAVHGKTRGAHVRTISVREFMEGKEQTSARIKKSIKEMLLSFVWFYPEEYDLLQTWAGGDLDFVKDYFDDNPESALRLEQWGITRLNDLAIPDMARYLRVYGDEYRREISPFKGTDIALDILAEEPDMAVLEEIFKYRVKVEGGLRRTISLYEGVEFGFDPKSIANSICTSLRLRADGSDPRDFFTGRSISDALQALTLREVAGVISSSWERYAPLFGHGQRALDTFTENLRLVAKARNEEAHTRNLTIDDLEAIRPAFSWFLSKLKNLPQ